MASYIHFNKIYPQQLQDPAAPTPVRGSPLRRAGTSGTPTAGTGVAGALSVKEGLLPRVPHMAGFPNHCTDTILLRMMLEMNRPGAVLGMGLGPHQTAGAPSVRSSISNKYSDVGRHRDLDEVRVWVCVG